MADKKPRTFGAPMGTPDAGTDYSRGRPQAGMNRSQIRKAMAEPSKASTPYSPSRSSSTPRANPNNVPMGSGLLGRAKKALGGRGRQVDSEVERATTGKKK